MNRTDSRNYWPLGIVIALATFAGGLAAFIWLATSSNSDLVVEDYYEQELRYQDQIDRSARTGPVADQVTLRYEPLLRKILLQMPTEHVGATLTGELHLYRPAAAGLDRTVPLELNAAGMQVVDATGMAEGRWEAKIRWTADDTGYCVERRLIIEPAGQETEP